MEPTGDEGAVVDPDAERRKTVRTAVIASFLVCAGVVLPCAIGAAVLATGWMGGAGGATTTTVIQGNPYVAGSPYFNASGTWAQDIALGSAASAPLTTRDGRARFAFELPRHAVTLRLRIECDGGPVHADLSFDTPRSEVGHSDWDEASPESAASMEWTVSRVASPAFAPGRVLVEVHADDPDTSPSEVAPWNLTVTPTLVEPPTPVVLAVGTAEAPVPAEEFVSEERGWYAVYFLPAGTGRTPLRIDLVPEQSDLDLLVQFGQPAYSKQGAVASSVGVSAVESVVLGTEPDLRPSRADPVFITVLDPEGSLEPSRFRLFATAGSEAPAVLRDVPPLPAPADERERAMLTVVELAVGESGGSGVLVSEDGLVLTARHVVEDARPPGDEAAAKSPDVVVSASPDVRIPAKPLFRARVLAWDDGSDVALLRIERGAFGQPLPEGYRFPAAVRADARPRLGETLTTVGYPRLEGDPARNPVTVSRGILSGHTAGRTPQLARTDAFVAGGSSGGSVLDAKGRLVGVVLEGHSEGEGGQRLSAYLPIDSLPEGFRALLGW